MGCAGAPGSWAPQVDPARPVQAMSGSCKFDGCTVDETGVCALERHPSSCSNRVTNEVIAAASGDIQSENTVIGDRLGAAVLDQPARASAFPSSRTLGL